MNTIKGDIQKIKEYYQKRKESKKNKKSSGCLILLISILIPLSAKIIYMKIEEPEFFGGAPRGLEQTAQKMLDYLEYKYDEEFVYIRYIDTGVGFTRGGTVIEAYPKGKNPEENTCTVVQKNKYKHYYQEGYASDNYFAILIRDEYEAMIREEVDKYFDEYKLYVRVNTIETTLPDYLSKDSTLDDYLESLNREGGPITPDSYLIFPNYGQNEKVLKNQIIKISNNIKNKKKRAVFLVRLLNEPYYKEMQKEGWWKYLNNEKVAQNKLMLFMV